MEETEKRKSVSPVEAIAGRLLEELASAFPVCSASDEFYYFPQVETPPRSFSRWDDFSPEKVAEFTEELLSWEAKLNLPPRSPLDPEEEIDLGLLRQAVRTLREEISEVRFQHTRPTFYLTVATIGLAAALESGAPEAWARRVRGLPAFLDQGRENLKDVPVLFRDLGLEMVSGCRRWLDELSKTRPGLSPSLGALARFEERLRAVPTREDFRLPEEVFERIIRSHLRCGEGVKEILLEIEEEVRQMEETLKEEAGRLLPGASWLKAFAGIPAPPLPAGGLPDLFRREIKKLAGHCRELGIIPPGLPRAASLKVAPVPPYLSAIRTASAYSMAPGQTAAGGTFFIIRPGGGGKRKEPARDWRMLSAHETYPGHHLLDSCRWNLSRPLRRHFESPLFYEGWACFAEELLASTGYFRGPADRLLLARRRLWRALRGRVDLGLQSGEMDISAAAGVLGRAGLSRKQALSAARKYTLRPGYQVCYTVGLKRFLDLYSRYGENNPSRFTRPVLSQGEIGFEALETIFKKKSIRQD